jgi:hypothetical protein
MYEKMIYVDNSATTAVSEKALSARVGIEIIGLREVK